MILKTGVHSDVHQIFFANPSDATRTDDAPASPKSICVSAVNRIRAAALGTVEVDYNAAGAVRTLAADGDGLFALPYSGNAVEYAQRFIAQPETRRALALAYTKLGLGNATRVPLGQRVDFQQTVKFADQADAIPVRGGLISVVVDRNGHIIQVTSTVRHGKRPARLGKIVSRDAAIAAAKEKHGSDVCNVKSCELVLSAHENKLDPCYEITLETCGPEYKLWSYLVKAKTAEVVYGKNKVYYSQRSKSQDAATDPACRYFPVTPNPKVALSQQLIDYVVSGLPDPTKLQNERFIVMTRKSGSWKVVTAKADGTFDYAVNSAEHEALIVFIAMNTMTAYQEERGAPKLESPIPVYVRDPDVRDNAYCTAQIDDMEVHIGIGSGVPNGLRNPIGYDKMVEIHEFCGHGEVTYITPGHDLNPGEHEAAGDMAAIVAGYLDRIEFAKQLGTTIDVAFVRKDPRIVGPYTMDGGIRTQRNTKTVADRTGEPHDDGEIVGAALADTLEGIIVADNDVASGCDKFVRLYLASLSMRPAHKDTWTDTLRTMITADSSLYQGSHRDLIEKSFAGHGIKLPAKSPSRSAPKGKGKGKSKSPKGKGKGKGRKAA